MKKRISGITYLKAFLPLVVISLHARTFGSSSFMSYPFPKYPDIKDIIYSNILTLAVPLFFLVSFYLYLLKRQNSDVSHGKLLGTRTLYFFELFLIWRVIYAVLGIGAVYKKGAGLVENLYLILFGGANSILYYLEVSIYLFILLEIVLRLFPKIKCDKTKIYLALSVFFTLLILGLNLVPFASLKVEALRYFSPVCFLPYVFIALIFDAAKDKPKIWHLSVLFVLGIISAILEWRFLPDTLFLQWGYLMALPTYGRPSVVLISSAIFGFSLYVYLIHQIVIKFVYGEVSNPVVGFLLVTVITYALSAAIYFAQNHIKNLIRKQNSK